ncbi:hypothetical protein Rsub_10349 [Raphidocelis subcapitata]|uniref:Guided entry of tail-anchored proteins 1 n=1 Tax=Raphidocelis subcapitata TaxID=307507 RepID=A0A2V0PDW5_9CHLO|nr:hypothetical protein Rsub_10349 [Raphidocelis subcapitata]|eukprot:GBF97162.1 hypothetical protein Rsub_10349 [Raphidocelis subcapitata]
MEHSTGALLFVALLLVNLTRWLVKRSQTGFLQQHKARLAREIASLRRQAETFNTPSTYAKCAKLQRLANAKEQELAALQQHGDRDVRARIAAAIATLKVILIALAVVKLWGRALLYIPPQLSWPFSRLLVFPHTSSYMELGAVTVVPWVTLCDRVSLLIARALFPLRGLEPRTKPLQTVHEEKEQ